MKQYILLLLLIFILAFLCKGNNKCYYHVTFETLQTKEERKWIKDTIVFEFDLIDSILSIKTKNEYKIFNILSISFNDYLLKNNTKADIYKLSQGYYLWVEKNPKNLYIIQLILFDNKEKHYIYK